MNYPAAPNGGIAASLGQATGYQAVNDNRPQGAENLTPVRLWTVYPPQADSLLVNGLEGIKSISIFHCL